MKKRMLSLFLSVILCLSLLPATALAEEADSDSMQTLETTSAEYAVQVTSDGNTTGYQTLAAAFAAAVEGDTVTLLNDGVSANAVTGKSITLKMNDKTLGEGKIDVLDGATLKISGRGDIAGEINVSDGSSLNMLSWVLSEIQKITLNANSSLKLPSTGNEKISTLMINDGSVRPSLSRCSYGRIACSESVKMKAGDLLSAGYAFKRQDGSFVSYDTEITAQGIYDVKAERCTHASVTDCVCDYCGMSGILAIRSTSVYLGDDTNKDDMIHAAFNDLSAGGTLKLFVDCAPEDVSIESIPTISPSGVSAAINLNGHTVSDCTLTLGSGINMSVMDTSEGKNGQFQAVNVKAGGHLTVNDGAKVNFIDVKEDGATLKLNAGAGAEMLDLRGSGLLIADCLQPDCYIANVSDGWVYDGYSLVGTSANTSYGFQVYQIPDAVTAENKNGSISRKGCVSADLFPIVETTDGSAPRLFYEWYRRTDSGAQLLAWAEQNENGSCTWTTGPAASSLTVDETISDAICVVSKRNADGHIIWAMPVTGYTLTVAKASLADATIVVTQEDMDKLVYTPNETGYISQQLKFTVEDSGQPLTEGTHYQIKDGSDTGGNAGEYTLTLEGLGAYAGSELTYNWTVKPRKLTDINKITKPYDGTCVLPDDITFSYDGGAVTLTSAGEDPDYTVDSGEYHSSDAAESKGANVAVTLKNRNYTFENSEMTKEFFIYEGDSKAAITKADASCTAPTAKTLTYTGSAQELVNAGSTADGTLMYSLNGIEWQDTVPTAVKAGVYTVWYKAIGDSNHKDSAPSNVQATIARQSVAIPEEDTRQFTYNGEDQTYTLATNDNYTIAGAVKKGAGTHKVTVSLKDTENYKWSDGTDTEKTYDFVIAKAAVTITVKDKYAYVNSAAPDLSKPEQDKDYTVSGLIGEDALTTEPTLTYDPVEPDLSKIGEAAKITASSASAGENYEIRYADGKLNVTTRSSSGSHTTYPITVNNSKNGSAASSRKEAGAGTTVTITVIPDKGYTLETLNALDRNGNTFKLTDAGDGKYTFAMPASSVTITATFMDDNTMLNFFVDVNADDYFYDAVLWAAQKGVTSGTDALHFSPDKPCTRAQIVTFLWRAAGSPVVNYAMNMTDVNEGAYYAEAVRWALSEGITTGTTETTFSPDETCTRAQAVTFLWRSCKSPAVDGADTFTDVSADAYYADAVAWAVKEKVTSGTTAATFSPDGDCSRAQIITFLYRLYLSK